MKKYLLPIITFNVTQLMGFVAIYLSGAPFRSDQSLMIYSLTCFATLVLTVGSASHIEP